MSENGLNTRTAADWIADAERYERWAARVVWNSEICENFRRLAEEARAKAGRAN